MANKPTAPSRPIPAAPAKRSMSEMSRLMNQRAVAPKAKTTKGK